MLVSNAMVITLHYTLRDEAGKVLENSDGNEPLIYLHGAENIIRGLEEGLEGLKKGDAFEVTVSPKMGYGERNPRLKLTLERNKFPADADIKVGDRFIMNHQNESRPVEVLALEGDKVKVDANHHLAGKVLKFSGSIVDIREGTPEELHHGHVHGLGGHHH